MRTGTHCPTVPGQSRRTTGTLPPPFRGECPAVPVPPGQGEVRHTVVVEWPRGRCFGFVRASDGRKLLIHVNDIRNHRPLSPGEWIRYREVTTATGDTRAVDIHPIGGRP